MKQNIDILGEKGVAALSLMDRGNERRRNYIGIVKNSIKTTRDIYDASLKQYN